MVYGKVPVIACAKTLVVVEERNGIPAVGSRELIQADQIIDFLKLCLTITTRTGRP